MRESTTDVLDPLSNATVFTFQSGTTLRYLTIEILLFPIPLSARPYDLLHGCGWPCRFTRREDILLRNSDFPEHVLIKRVVDVELDPVQSNDALFELLRKFPIDQCAARKRIHLRNNCVRAAASLGVIIRADSAATVGQTFWK